MLVDAFDNAQGILLTRDAMVTSDRIKDSLEKFVAWLSSYGEDSQDVDDYFNNAYGRWSKSQYYRHKVFGTLMVAPLVLQEAFFPWTRKFFWPAQRFPLADAHYAMGFVALFGAYRDQALLERAKHFADVLVQTRTTTTHGVGWGYPFGWETVWGNFPAGTPLITTTPYCYEAFDALVQVDQRDQWIEMMRLTAEHALREYNRTEHAPGVWASSYSPIDHRKVVNANAYRAFLLTAAAHRFDNSEYLDAAKEPLNFVLHSQQADGSWLYAMENVDQFIDHYHTCFVMKALAKIYRLTNDERVGQAIAQGVDFYFKRIIDEKELPRPFAKPPRLIIYRRELYDLAEAINLALLLRGRFPRFNRTLNSCVAEVITRWQRPDGSFPTRELLLGWNRVPMHRWGSAIIFRSLSLLLNELVSDGRTAPGLSSGSLCALSLDS